VQSLTVHCFSALLLLALRALADSPLARIYSHVYTSSLVTLDSTRESLLSRVMSPLGLHDLRTSLTSQSSVRQEIRLHTHKDDGYIYSCACHESVGGEELCLHTFRTHEGVRGREIVAPHIPNPGFKRDG